MKTQISAVALLALCLLATPTLAQPDERAGEGDRPRGAARERILRAFDKDGDGRLNQEERAAVREQLGERFDEIRRRAGDLFEERRDGDARDRAPRRREGDRPRPPRRDEDRDRPRDAGPRDRGPRERDARDRGPGERALRGARRPGGPLGPRGPMRGGPERDLQPLFGWFDIDGDNMLNRREFAQLSQFVQRQRPMLPGGPGGPRVGWRGPGGPGEVRVDVIRRLERRRDFERDRRDEGRDRRDVDRREGDDQRRDRPREARERDERRGPDERRREDGPGRPRPAREDARPSAADNLKTAAGYAYAI